MVAHLGGGLVVHWKHRRTNRNNNKMVMDGLNLFEMNIILDFD